MNRIAIPGLVLFLALLLGACAAQTDLAYRAENVSPADVLAHSEERVILDVRTPAEYRAGHVEGAVNIDVDSPEFRTRVASLDRSSTYVVHCSANVPNGRSARAMTAMTELGFVDLENLVGGYAGWTDAGGEVVADE